MSVKIMHEIDVSEKNWCNSAIMFRVWNGKGIITHQCSRNDENYYYYSKLLLDGKPILQAHLSGCPTCTGLLATGYGIENIDCPELKAVRESLNGEYKDIRTSAEMLKPLLNLLDDGYYLLADVPHDPTDGNSNFFWSVPNNLTENPACLEEYYTYENFFYKGSFPKYLYPTQSADLCNQKRIEEYVEILKNNPNPPRALAYHEHGFISALLDGHHKATASALLGQAVNCLTIMNVDGVHFEEYAKPTISDTRIKFISFSDITVPVPAGSLYGDYFGFKPKTHENLTITEYNLTGKKFPQAESNAETLYLDIESLMGLYDYGIENTEFTDELIDEWINNCNYDNCYRLKYTIRYLMLKDKNMAYRTILKVLKGSSDYYYGNGYNFLPDVKDWTGLHTVAWTALKKFRDEKTEQIFIDYIVSHNKNERYWDIVTSYWD
ncbi:MAG: hypothetical protein K2G36_02050 [Ruminococcus sp.]|nr:hypothetical protein [Ruminococcus sp.]